MDWRRFEVGSVVTGTVSLISRPGAIGIFVGLGGEPRGFVDVLSLPRQVAAWPGVGTTSTFEVLTREPAQIRLWPLDRSARLSPRR